MAYSPISKETAALLAQYGASIEGKGVPHEVVTATMLAIIENGRKS